MSGNGFLDFLLLLGAAAGVLLLLGVAAIVFLVALEMWSDR